MRHLLWVLFLGLLATSTAQVLTEEHAGQVEEHEGQIEENVEREGKATKSTVIHLITSPYNRAQHRGAENEYLAAIAQLAAENAQVQAREPEVVDEDAASQKTAEGILEAVSKVVGALTPNLPGFSNQAQPSVETSDPAAAEADEAVANTADTPTAEEETQPENTAEANKEVNPNPVVDEEQPGEVVTVVEANEEAPTDPPTPAENEGETAQPNAADTAAVEESTPSKKELKAISNYNAVVDKVLPILSKKLKAVGALPITVDEASLIALDVEADPEPPVEDESNKGTRKNMKKKKNKKKNRKNKRRNQGNKRNNDMAEEDGRDNRKKSSEKGNNKSAEKGNNRSNEKGNNRSNEKGNNRNKNNKNKKKNKNNRRNKNRSNQPSRRPKAMYDEDEEEYVEEGRRKTSRNNNKNNKNRKQQKGGNKGKKGKNNRRNKNKNNKGRSEIEAREDMGPVLPTAEERSASNARMTGLTQISREGDVAVDLTGKKHKVTAAVNIGPLMVNLKDKARSLTKAQVTTNLQAVINFRVKAVSRRNKINVVTVEANEITLEDVEVVRTDLDLETEVISAAQQQVVDAVDTSRIARILDQELVTIFQKDNFIENLEDHPFLLE